MTTRRQFLSGLGSLIITAPAIVHAGNLMPVKVMEPLWHHYAYNALGELNEYFVDGFRMIARPGEFHPSTHIYKRPDAKISSIRVFVDGSVDYWAQLP